MQDGILMALSGRAYIYRLLSALLGNKPDAKLMDAAIGGDAIEQLQLFAGESDEYDKALGAFEGCARLYCENPEKELGVLEAEYTRLFIGPERLPSPPWESVHVSNEQLLFQKNTLEVREAYAEFSMIPEGYPHVADDHISIELDFMRELAERTIAARESVSGSEAENLLDGQKAFLDKHLLKWAGQFAGTLRRNAVGFYPCAAELANAFLVYDRKILDELGSGQLVVNKTVWSP
jgi:TorA maturation chaperone TorD